MKTELLKPTVLDSLNSRGHTMEDISSMSPERAFDEYCTWHGLIGWGPVLQSVLHNIQSASKDAAIQYGDPVMMRSHESMEWMGPFIYLGELKEHASPHFGIGALTQSEIEGTCQPSGALRSHKFVKPYVANAEVSGDSPSPTNPTGKA